ncbi:DUF1566 domain-containing protein, partial [Shewanella algae]|uniref:Lcl domain-containing protein n=1 Tax=Shewanella algae TaxID=38313 RepID=UPI0023597E9C
VGTTTLTATKDGISSNTVNVDVVCTAAGPCIDIFNTGNGKLFTNSPSVAYLDSIGGSAITGTFTQKNGAFGPAGIYYLFTWSNANALCETYNTNSIGGRTNWRLPTRDELKTELYDVFGNMFIARGWPTENRYWSVSPIGTDYYYVNLHDGGALSYVPGYNIYASCVSNP